jgi:hypothetical protein
MTRIGRTAFGFSHGLTCKASAMIALPEGGGICRFLGSLTTPTGPTACTRQQWLLADIAAGVVRDMQHDSSPAFMKCDIAAAGAVRDVQHDSSNSAAGTCEGGGAQEPKSMI